MDKKECIPVGCVPPALWLYPVVSHVFWGGGSAQPLIGRPERVGGCDWMVSHSPCWQTREGLPNLPCMQTPLVGIQKIIVFVWIITGLGILCKCLFEYLWSSVKFGETHSIDERSNIFYWFLALIPWFLLWNASKKWMLSYLCGSPTLCAVIVVVIILMVT